MFVALSSLGEGSGLSDSEGRVRGCTCVALAYWRFFWLRLRRAAAPAAGRQRSTGRPADHRTSACVSRHQSRWDI